VSPILIIGAVVRLVRWAFGSGGRHRLRPDRRGHPGPWPDDGPADRTEGWQDRRQAEQSTWSAGYPERDDEPPGMPPDDNGPGPDRDRPTH